jgi:hypothetical protein
MPQKTGNLPPNSNVQEKTRFEELTKEKQKPLKGAIVEKGAGASAKSCEC